MRRIVLITNIQADLIYGGGAILRKIFPLLLPKFQIDWFYILKNPENVSALREITNLKINRTALQSNLTGYPIIPYLRKIHKNLGYRIQMKYQNLYNITKSYFWAKKIYKNLKEDDIVWGVLQDETVHVLYFLYKKNIQNKLHLSIHDDCRFDFTNPDNYDSNHDRLKFVLKKAVSIDTIGNNLKDEYKRIFDVSSRIYRRGFKNDSVSPRPAVLKDKYRLMFTGNSHSNKSWFVLLDKLSILDTIQFDIHLFGNNYYIPEIQNYISEKAYKNIQMFDDGIIKESEILSKSKDFDFAIFMWDYFDYKPYWMKFSVSTKLTTYLACGLPIIGLISRESEVFGIYDYQIAFDAEKTTKEGFAKWLNQENFKENYERFVRDYFNEELLDQNFLSAEAFADIR